MSDDEGQAIDLEELLRVLKAIRAGDVSVRLSGGQSGIGAEIASTVNGLAEEVWGMGAEVSRLAQEIGGQGVLGGQARVPTAGGIWKDMADRLNGMAGNLTGQIRDLAAVTTAVAHGDLTRKVTVDARGEILELKTTINGMVDLLGSYASEATRILREVWEGKFGGQAEVRGAEGTWRDLVDSTNHMSATLTDQIRNISAVTHAVAKGDFTRKVTVEARGETLELKVMINTMIDQLNAFAADITRAARGIGGPSPVSVDSSGVHGTWKDVLESVDTAASAAAGRG